MGGEQRLTARMHQAIDTVHAKITKLEVDHLTLSTYGRAYFKLKRPSLLYELELYGYAIQKSMDLFHENSDGNLVELGGGLGIGSILAAIFTESPVTYLDIDADITGDARTIAQAIDIHNIDHQHITSVNNHLKAHDVVFSKDVIEHIYNLPEFLNAMSSYSIPQVHLTTANPHNVFRKKYFAAIHKNAEHAPSQSNKSGQSKKSYLQERLDYIQEHFSNLSTQEKETLSKLSKGLIFNDITPSLLQNPHHKNSTKIVSNTCDPATGNWAERLLQLNEYRDFSERAGYQHQAFGLPYDEHKKNKIKNLASRGLNALLNLNSFRCKSLVTTQMHVLTPKQEK